MPIIIKPPKLLEHWQAERNDFEESICADGRCCYCNATGGISECKTKCIHPGANHNALPEHFEPDDYSEQVMHHIREMCKSI